MTLMVNNDIIIETSYDAELGTNLDHWSDNGAFDNNNNTMATRKKSGSH